jgi:CheY-like chemotaxis protein
MPARIDVIDTGIGIAPNRLQSVFGAFQQEDGTKARQYGGTGLGLTITRSLAHPMGYEVEVVSEVGVGSTFSVILALDSAAFAAARTTSEIRAVVEQTLAATPMPNRPFRVLVIDDELDARTILENQLDELGCEVITAATADEGITLAKRVKPDLITLDIMMPRKNGWEALREIKANAELRDIPVVIVSVVAREMRGRLLGAVDFIDKPVTRDALIDVIRRNVSKAGLPRVLLVHDHLADLHRYREFAASDALSLDIVAGIDDANGVIASSPRPIDLVVLDLSQWSTPASAWVLALNNDPATASIRVVVVVSDSLMDTFTEPRELGATVLRRDDDFAADLAAIVDGLRKRTA